MTTIGASQEGADEATVRQIALREDGSWQISIILGIVDIWGWRCRRISAYSVAIRGKRHTYRRMAMSLLR